MAKAYPSKTVDGGMMWYEKHCTIKKGGRLIWVCEIPGDEQMTIEDYIPAKKLTQAPAERTETSDQLKLF